MSYAAEKTGNIYAFNTAEKLNRLLIKLLLVTDRFKSFLFRSVVVLERWIRTARQYKLNIYSCKPYGLNNYN